jgi:hypothetical protein
LRQLTRKKAKSAVHRPARTSVARVEHFTGSQGGGN